MTDSDDEKALRVEIENLRARLMVRNQTIKRLRLALAATRREHEDVEADLQRLKRSLKSRPKA